MLPPEKDGMPEPILTHVALTCADVQRTIQFYRDYAGMHVVHERRDSSVTVAWVSREREDPRFVLVLIEGQANQPAPPPAVDHLGFACETRAEVDAIAAQANTQGVPVVVGPVQWPPPVGYFVIIEDPDANRVEFSHGQPINPNML